MMHLFTFISQTFIKFIRYLLVPLNPIRKPKFACTNDFPLAQFNALALIFIGDNLNLQLQIGQIAVHLVSLFQAL